MILYFITFVYFKGFLFFPLALLFWSRSVSSLTYIYLTVTHWLISHLQFLSIFIFLLLGCQHYVSKRCVPITLRPKNLPRILATKRTNVELLLRIQKALQAQPGPSSSFQVWLYSMHVLRTLFALLWHIMLCTACTFSSSLNILAYLMLPHPGQKPLFLYNPNTLFTSWLDWAKSAFASTL